MHLDCRHCGRGLEFTGDPPLFCAYCGKALADSSTTNAFDPEATIAPAATVDRDGPGPPGTLGGYRILRRLGGGGMGTVYEAEAASSGHRVALKVILPEFATSAVAVERFRQEGRLASSITHPRCVFVLAADEEAGQPYIVMELMSGTTLQQWVEERGPLAVPDAVAKILDVIDGLVEAHRLGVVHRDVKPSNCFLLDDGRVKVGDFGLSKSLVRGADLTRTGTFLGTLLYASPEQIKGERVDFRTDVYSVAATLYYLLGGQAPFQSKDAAATLARTVSEPPPSLRLLRPEVSRALEKVIRRGLERNPERRWRSMDDFRAALVRFVPSRLSIGAMGLRAAADIIDTGLIGLLVAGLLAIIGPVTGLDEAPWATIIYVFAFLAFYGISEGLGGAAPGKWLLRLRVCTTKGCDPPGFLRATGRALIFYAATILVSDLNTNLPVPEEWEMSWELDIAWNVVGLVSLPAGVLVVASTMRARNGYRGPHELLTGTRVVRLPWPRRSDLFTSRCPDRLSKGVSRTDGLPESIGPFSVHGSLCETGAERWLLAEDPGLARRILICCRPRTSGLVDPARRILHRATRLRWLSAGQQADLTWEAFLAPVGCPLSDLCDSGHRLSWRGFRGILEQLTDELGAACADGTLPPILSVEQVWIQPQGRVQLLDAPLTAGELRADSRPDERALCLLRDAAEVALEGRLRTDQDAFMPIQAPVPEHAAGILARIAGGDGYRTVAQLQADLAATHDRLADVNRALRAGHLVILGMAVLMPLIFLFAVVLAMVYVDPLGLGLDFVMNPALDISEAITSVLIGFILVAFFPVIWIVWAFLFRGGFTLPLMGLTLACPDGRRAPRWRCAWRAFVVWAPLVVLLNLSMIAKVINTEATVPALVLWSLAVAYVVGCGVLALLLPARSLHDRLAWTYLVPR